MRNKFDEELQLLNRKLIEMGALCEEIITASVNALINGDTSVEKIEAVDTEIDHLERDIESICLKLLLQQQPVARDLRQISAALKMITDMERIGDQAADIAEIIPYISYDETTPKDEIKGMALAAIEMVTGSIEAFVKQDSQLAESVIAKDDIVDSYFDKIKATLITLISENRTNGENALDFLMIAKYFERIGDHATNIAEWVLFSMTGTHKGEC